MNHWEEKIQFVRSHYESKGYRVHSGLQFGAELVLYADRPDLVHSDFCIHVVQDDELIDWREMQTLVRSMPDLHKTLVLCLVSGEGDDRIVQEIAMATEHAPFRQRTKKFSTSVGSQKKKKKNNQKKKNANDNNDKIDLKNTKSGNNNKRIRTEPA